MVIARRGVRGDAASPPGRGPIMFTLHKNGVIFRYKIAREGRRDGWCSPLPSRRAAFGRASFSQGSPILACLAIVLGHQAAQFAAWKSRKTARQCTLVLLSYRRDAPLQGQFPHARAAAIVAASYLRSSMWQPLQPDAQHPTSCRNSRRRISRVVRAHR